MSNRPTNWVTIPEEKVHTPASGKPKSGAKSEPVKNKLFWGAGFIAMVIVTFALLAPSQFNELIQGNLFDAAGEEFQPQSALDIVPDEVEEAASETMEKAAETLKAVADKTAETAEEKSVVEAQGEAVPVAVEPIAEPEPIEIEPVVSEEPAKPAVEACGEDIECFIAHLSDCSPATAAYTYQVMGNTVGADLEITGEMDEQCTVEAQFTQAPPLLTLKGKEAVCSIEKGEYTESSLEAQFSDMNNVLENCSGTAVDLLEQFMALMGSAPEEEKQDDQSAKDDLISQLTEQVEALKNQKGAQDKALQDLTSLVQDQLQGAQDTLRGSAPETVGQAGIDAVIDVISNLPGGFNIPTVPGVTSTSQIGQGTAVQPLFRVNPYTVTQTPEQVLRQRLAQGSTYTPPGALENIPQQSLQANVSGVTQTPASGPETLWIVLAGLFLAVIGWRFTRLFA